MSIEMEGAVFVSVSYTHLDVYKRQCMYISVVVDILSRTDGTILACTAFEREETSSLNVEKNIFHCSEDDSG